MNVNYSPLIDPPRVTLTVRTLSVFRTTVTFAVPIRFVPFEPDHR